MAQVTMTICDRHHQSGEDVPGTPRRFVIDGFKGTVDLCDACYALEVEPLLNFVRSMSGQVASKPPSRSRRRSKKSVADTAVVRAWALENGIEVSPRGRLPQGLLEQYRAAQD